MSDITFKTNPIEREVDSKELHTELPIKIDNITQSIITFKTNPIEREIDGKKSRTELSIPIDRAQVENLKELKELFLAEAKKQNVYIKINNFAVNGRELTDLSEIDYAKNKASDFTANVTQLTEHELAVLKAIKVLKEEIKENKDLLDKMSSTRDLLLVQLQNLDIEIKSLTETSQELREKMLEKAAKLQRLVPTAAAIKPQTSVIPSVGKQAATMFASSQQVHRATITEITATISNSHSTTTEVTNSPAA